LSWLYRLAVIWAHATVKLAAQTVDAGSDVKNR
jgi:hypothetical protein